MAKVLIVGGVAGGMTAAARLRRNDEKAEIIVFEKGGYVSFANCGLPYFIGGEIKERDSLLLQTPRSFKERFNVDVRIHSEVLAIYTKNKTVKVRDLNTGKEYIESYDKLILSPGAKPIRPELPGINHPAIFTLRNIPDADNITAFIQDRRPKRAVIIGAGYIGLEMADNLMSKGIPVTIVEAMPQVLSIFDFDMAAIMQDELKHKNIELYLNDKVLSFEDAGGAVKINIASGKQIQADMVILSIGVVPDSKLAEEAGLTLGVKKSISVNEYMQTSDPDIYAVGDAIQIKNPVTGRNMVIPLAGPANKQGRIAADNAAFGNTKKYNGTLGTGIAKIFDLTAASTGANELMLREAGIAFKTAVIHPNDHAGYYPGALSLTLKIYFSPQDGRLLGAQCVGYAGVDKRIDVIAAYMAKAGTVYDLEEFEHTYAPPYSSAKDPVNMAGFTAENMLSGKLNTITWKELNDRKQEFTLIDVRTQEEFLNGTIAGAINIPVDELRTRLSEIPKGKKLAIFCRVGMRGYIATKILSSNGFSDVVNLSGGYLSYSTVMDMKSAGNHFGESYDTNMASASYQTAVKPAKINMTEINACGLACPGPIMKLKKGVDLASNGDMISIMATDPGFYNDVTSWASATGNKLISINSQKGVISAVIEKGALQENSDKPAEHGKDKTIILFSGDLDKAIAAFIIANGALAMGRKVTIFFTFWGLNVLKKASYRSGAKKNILEIMFGWMMPRGSTKLKLSKLNMAGMGPVIIRQLMKSKNVDSLELLIKSALESGARLIACQMTQDLLGIKNDELIDGVEFGGVATYLEAQEHGDMGLFI
jgi:NADPH-dependent 2,4-dienoyl-CoA reductase/sulfur reductase-like enzyme/peroxiredoxin family protein/rhodanese-related sulfurtransferase/TusA-related sulfurtransferase